MKMKNPDAPTFWEKLRNKIGWKFYDLDERAFRKARAKKKGGKPKTLQAAKRGNAIFCAVMLALPLLQFILFYVCVNINSLLLAFQRFDLDGNRVFAGLDNFKTLFYQFKTESVFSYALKNSIIAYLFTVILATPIALLFAFYIYKKALGGKFFKIMLFLPSVISAIVMVMIYMYFVDLGIPQLVGSLLNKHVSGLFSNNDTKFATVMFYTVCVSFGSSILMYLSAMKSINPSLVEAAELEGANYTQEFIYITFPLIYPTFTTFFVVGIAGIFTNQVNLVSFMGTDQPLPQFQTFGYYMYQQTVEGSANYPRLTALGLMITVVVAPVTLIVKWLMEKYGPSEGGR